MKNLVKTVISCQVNPEKENTSKALMFYIAMRHALCSILYSYLFFAEC